MLKYYLGYCYGNGIGINKENKDQIKWYMKSRSFAGCPSKQCNLRLCYASGIGTDKNETKSFEWYLKSAGEYHAVAQKYVGVLPYKK
uniref:Uncharacterized protein n=1 Tax=Rhizophagus irregularis (strain DAOM 181602 / DAOM 197198 / MUCL 43194) TaxID=747089 RepID=U9TPF9_RHIID